VLVRQRIIHRLNLRNSSQNGIRHLVHHSLHTGTILLCEEAERDLTCAAPRIIKARRVSLHRSDCREQLPSPGSIHLGAEDPVPDLGQRGVFVAHKAPELRACALQHVQALDAGGDFDALALGHVDLHVARLGAVAQERVRVRLAVDSHTCPAVGDDADVRDVDVAVRLDEVGADDGTKELGGGHWVLFGEDEDGVFNGVGGHDDAVVGLGVSATVSFMSYIHVLDRLTRHQPRPRAGSRWSSRRRFGRPSSRRGAPCRRARCPCHSGQQRALKTTFRCVGRWSGILS
jgi:hypothetical protein